ncbi:MAG: hypothetical protein IPN76_07455 [Saprospiraceae bacterium]|nr:hypothetical protein [Saprospiraceae bacterium]
MTASNRYNEVLTYSDARGNIGTLQRQGAQLNGACWDYAQIDNLTYTYTAGTNRLASIADAASATYKAKGFNPGTGTGSYAYDVNGNMTTDPHKGLTITYNHLNLPKTFNFGGGKVIDILYDAAGNKLRKTIVGSASNYTQEYIGGIEYRGTVREAIYTTEGRYNSGTSRYEYTIKDHLGNARVSFTDVNVNGSVDFSTEVLQENHYYPFGLNFDGNWKNDAARDNRYQYNDKELNDDFGLDWYEYGARGLDRATGRWWSVDPMAEPTASHSTYHYAYNNPVSYIDMFGMWPKAAAAAEKEMKPGEKLMWIQTYGSLGEGPPHRWKKYFDSNGNETYEYVDDVGGDYKDYVDNYDECGNFCHTDKYDVYKTVSNDVRDVGVGPGVRVGYGTTPAEFEAIIWVFGGKVLTKLGGRLLAGGAATGGGNIALGVSEHLDDFAKSIGGSTWKSWGRRIFNLNFYKP